MAEAQVEIDPAELGTSLQVVFATSRKLMLIRKRRERLPSNEHSGNLYYDDLIREQKFFEDAVEEYSRTWCRSFVTRMMRHIRAREIRDMIYTRLLDDEIGYKDVMINNDEFMTYSSGRSTPWKPQREATSLAYVLTRAYMGTQFATEMSQTVYEHACFWVYSSEELQDLILRGPLEPNLVAPCDFIRHVNFTINLSDWHYYLSGSRSDKDPEDMNSSSIHSVRECRRLKHIKRLELGLKVDVQSERAADKYEGTLLQVIGELEQLGAKVTLEWTSYRPTTVKHRRHRQNRN